MAGTLERAGAEIVMHGPEMENASRMWSRDHTMIDETYAWFDATVAGRGRRRHARVVARDRRAVDEVEKSPQPEMARLDLGGRHARLKWTPGHTTITRSWWTSPNASCSRAITCWLGSLERRSVSVFAR